MSNYYYRARYYDPYSQKFLSEDPIGLNGGIHSYLYVGNNPLIRIDPYGLASCTYSIKERTLRCVPNGGGLPKVLGPSGVVSGQGRCENNPDCKREPGLGPIPPGSFTIERHPAKKDWWMLRPSLVTFVNSGFRRSFRLHPGVISQGCISADPSSKRTMDQFREVTNLLNSENGANTLEVFED